MAIVVGTDLTVIHNTGREFIDGVFDNLRHGQVVEPQYAGQRFAFAADYFGGAGNDLVLVWKTRRGYAWGDNAHGQAGDGTMISRPEPPPASIAATLSGSGGTPQLNAFRTAFELEMMSRMAFRRQNIAKTACLPHPQARSPTVSGVQCVKTRTSATDDTPGATPQRVSCLSKPGKLPPRGTAHAATPLIPHPPHPRIVQPGLASRLRCALRDANQLCSALVVVSWCTFDRL